MKNGKVCIFCGRVSEGANFFGEFKDKLHICPDCFEELPGYNRTHKHHYLIFCDKHNFTVSGQNNKDIRECALCVEEKRTVSCEICKKEYINKNRHLNRIKNNNTINICDDCNETLDGEGFPRKCFSCGEYVKVKHNFNLCPKCNSPMNKYNNICNHCNVKFNSNSSKTAYCKKCSQELGKSKAVLELEKVKMNPFVKIRNDIVMYPITTEKHKLYPNSVLTCPCCHRPFYRQSSTQVFCGFCKRIVRCDECHMEYQITNVKFNRRTEYENHYCSPSCRASAINKRRKPLEIKYSSENTKDFKKFTELTDENILDFQFPGVWCITDGEHVLNVHLTSNIYKEYLLPMKKNIREYCENNNITPKKYFIQPIYSKEEGIYVEMKFAMESNAIFWHPAPGKQTSDYFKKFNGGKEIC